MSETKSVNVSLPGGFTSLLALLFIGLKLAGVIRWSWVWVLAPIWIPVSIVVTILIFTVIVAILVALAEKR